VSEPDEALIWARSQVPEDWYDDRAVIGWRAEAYRAGQAASAESIKALEALLREIKPVAHLFQWNDLRDQINAVLKEADQ
jgi:hypothetical protein